MENIKNSEVSKFQILRTIFILGCLINITLYFVPGFEVTNLFDKSDGIYSAYEIIKILGEHQKTGLQLLYVTIVVLYIVFTVLAISYPKRWIFILGASLTVFSLLWNFSSSGNGKIHYLLIFKILSNLGDVFILSGFFIKHPTIDASLQDRRKKTEGKGASMINKKQRIILSVMAIAMFATFLYLPFGVIGECGYHFFYEFKNYYYGCGIHSMALIVEWIGIVILGGIFLLLAKDE